MDYLLFCTLLFYAVTIMQNSILFILAFLLSVPLYSQSGKKIVILHTNDLHSRLTGYAPESDYTPMTIKDDNTIGGFARIASVIKNEKRRNTGTTLVIDAGDFLMGTLFHNLEPSTGFQLRLMKEMGFDVACLGNHEFDFGPEKLATIITSSMRTGEIPSLLLGNAVFSSKDTQDDNLKELYSENIIGRKLIIERDGLKFGFFSILGKVADHDAPYAKPVTFSKQAVFAKKSARELKDEKCDVIICLSHSGITMNSKGEWEGEDVEIARAAGNIDLIISGHTHTKLEQPLIVNEVLIVQTGEYGQFIGRMELTFSGGDLNLDNYNLIPVNDDIPGDKLIHQLIEDQKAKVTDQILKPLGFDYNVPVAESGFLLECSEYGGVKASNLGPLVADAIRYYVNNHSRTGTDVSMVAAGVIRDRIVPGMLTAPDIFRVMSLGSGNDEVPGYPLSRLYVTGKELKSILEILQVAYKSTPGNYCFFSGIRVMFDPEKGLLRKISKVEIIRPDGTVSDVSFSKKDKSIYSITANSYMLEFIGIIKKMSFGLINVVPKDAAGNPVTDMKTTVIDMNENLDGIQEGKEWLAMMGYLGSMADVNGNGIPDIDKKYSLAVQTFIQGE